MRLHRFFVGAELKSGPQRIDDLGLIKQWKNVLRMQAGDHLIICDGRGHESDAVIKELTATAAVVQLENPRIVEAEPRRHVTLCASILKRENFEWVVMKATEIGVKEIIPVLAARTVKTGLKRERLESIAKEASEQCGRGIIPMIHQPMTLAEAMKQTSELKNIFFHLGNYADNLPTADRLAIWTGPEGGWTDDEAAIAQSSGHELRSLGKLALRAETAAVVGSFLAVASR